MGVFKAAVAAEPRRRKVLYITVSLDVGGTEQQLCALARALNRERFEPVICCLAHPGVLADELTQAGIEVHAIGLHKFPHSGFLGRVRYATGAFLGAARLLHFVTTMRADVVQTFLLWPCIFGAIAARLARVPLVLSSRRSLNHVRQPAFGPTSLQRLANAGTHAIVANSDAVRDDVIQRERPPASTRLIVIRNGIDIATFAQAEPIARSDLGLHDGPVVGVIANFLPYKGHATLLEAWRKVLQRHPSATVLLIGDGPLRAPLETYVRKHDLRSVKFLGTRRDVARLLATVDLVVQPSLEEGSANAVLEAMAAAKPVVATVIGGNAEAVLNRESGLLVPAGDPHALADALVWLIDHPAAARAFGAAARLRVQSLHRMESMVAAYEALYEGRTARLAVPSAP